EHVIRQLQGWISGRTLVLVTHRPALLKMVDRIVVMDNGRIVADGPRDEILRRATTPAPAPSPGKGDTA
ncbi:MAG: hypothetical protein ABN483_16550, partial [Pantoea agglomerans]